MVEAIDDYAKNPTRLVLWDFQLGEGSMLSGATIQQIARTARQIERPKDSRVAIYAPRLDFLGTARQAEAYAVIEKVEFPVRVFRHRKAALAWLTERPVTQDDVRK